MSDDQKNDLDSKIMLHPSVESGKRRPVSLEHLKSVYICEAITEKELAERFAISEVEVRRIVKENKLQDLREAHIRNGLAQLQNVQVKQAEKLMDLESQFKRMRILQLEEILKDYMTYFSRHGHFYKVHPHTGDILKDSNGIPMQIRLPNITKEITDLKEAVTLSEGMKNLLNQIDKVINKPKDVESLDDGTIDMSSLGNIFQAKKVEDSDEDGD